MTTRDRAKPGSKGGGNFYHIVLRPESEFVLFRNQDVGKPGGLERVSGKRSSGSWSTQAWLVSKKMAHIEDGKLVPDHKDAKELLAKLRKQPTHEKGDIFVTKK